LFCLDSTFFSFTASMGVYLSTPEKTKHSEEGANNTLEFGLSSMQGWRRSMEDSHIAQLDFDNTPNGSASFFAVFDGHGGPEVALFCKNFMLKELVQLEAFQQQNYELALKQVFHRIDQLLEIEENHHLLENYKKLANPRADTFEGGSNEQENKGRRETMSIFEALKLLSGYMNQPQTNIPSAQEEEEEAEEQEVEEHESEEYETGEHEKNENGKPVQTNDLELGVDKSEKNDAKDDFSHALNLISTDTSIEIDEEAISGFENESLQSTSETNSTSHDVKKINLAPDSKVEETKENLTKPNTENKIEKLTSIKNNLNFFDNEIDEELKIVFAEGDSSYCRLPEHRVQAGCTSVVALVCGEYLFVANAGDSRGVLSRNGQAIPMSFDHKPTSKTEYTRIRQAGGFVNSVGRVNGNLNLSRAIGDLKYKQIQHVSAEQQIITAEPDIETFKISKEDEFFVLACDGIWDCMTNQEIVDFIRERIGKKKLSEIVEDILDNCLAEDVRKTNGIGTDNMTCIIVQFHHNN